MLDTESGEVTEKTLHMKARRCGSFTPRGQAVLVGLEATGSMFWFLRLLEELGSSTRGTSGGDSQGGTRKQKHDRRDAE